MAKYTVLLLVPVDLAPVDNDIYVAHCKADYVQAAIYCAREAAMTAYDAWNDGIEPDSFIPIAVFNGFLDNLKP